MPNMTRREFVYLGAATGAVLAAGAALPLAILTRDAEGNAVGAAVFFPEKRVASLGDLEIGVPVMFDYPFEGQASMLVKLGEQVPNGIGPDGDVVAFSRICTHMGCELTGYQAEHQVLGPCPCHFSTFDLIHGGQVVLGQATQSLPQIMISLDGETINANAVVGLVYGYADTLDEGVNA